MATKRGGESPWHNTDDELSDVEHRFQGIEIHGWKDQLTLRVFGISFIVGSFMTIVLMKLCLSLSLMIPFYIPIYPFSLILLESSITALDWFGLFKNNPITRQEISVMHACVVGFAKIVYYGGFVDYLFAMSGFMAKEFKTGRDENNWTTLKLWWIIIYLFLVCFIGLFTIIPAAKVFIVRYRLIYPSGFYAGHFINVFHTPRRFSNQRRQMQLLLKSCCGTLLFEGFRWLYSGGVGCGLTEFPTFGLQAKTLSFFSSLTPVYIAIGLICPHALVFSFLIGAIISWGFFWPFIRSKEGVWYPKETTSTDSVNCSYGYRVSLTSALFLGEGIFQLSLLALHSLYDMYLKKKPKRFIVPFHEEEEQQQQQQNNIDSQITATMSYDDQLRTKMFLKDIQIPTPISIGGFLLTSTISAVAIPFIFPQIEPRHIAAAYIAAPILNFCNAYTEGISDANFAPSYGKLTMFIFGSWIGLSHGGVLGSLIATGIVTAVMTPAVDLIQNFKLAYMTLTSPRSLLIGQVIGIAMGCFIVPIVFFYFYNSPNFGDPKSEYPMASARLYRSFAIRESQGLDSLPMHCVTLAVISFMVSLSLNIMKEIARFMNWRFHAYIPSPVAMAIPFYFTAAASLDFCLGSLVLFVWKRKNKKSADLYIPTVGAGLFIGEALKRLILTLLDNFTPAPMCVTFFSRDDYMSLQKNLTSLSYTS